MFVSYASEAYDPTSLNCHHASIRERVQAARYIGEREARYVIDRYTNIPKSEGRIYDHAVAVVQSSARDMQEAKKDATGWCPYDIIWDGLSVPEQLAQVAVESVQEALFEAMVS